MSDDKAQRAHLMIGDARVVFDGGFVGICEHPKIELGESASFTLAIDAGETPDEVWAGHFASVMASARPFERPPLRLQVARYSEADAMLGRALVSGEIIRGDVPAAYSWIGLRVTMWLPHGPDVIVYELRDAIQWEHWL